ncbi:MAG: hypothetical protein WC758_03655 [Candidatus Woesearchaeota archaeon]|jgi:hypothetical protein
MDIQKSIGQGICEGIGIGDLVPLGFIIDRIEDKFVLIPRQYDEAIIEVSLDEIIAGNFPDNIVLAKDLQNLPSYLGAYTVPQSQRAEYHHPGTFWLMSKDVDEKKPFILGASMIETINESLDESMIENYSMDFSFARIKNRSNKEKVIKYATDKNMTNIKMTHRYKFHELNISSKGLIVDFLELLEQENNLNIFSSFGVTKLVQGSSTREFEFAPLTFFHDGLIQLHQSFYSYEKNLLIKTRTLPVEYVLNDTINNCYKLLDREQGLAKNIVIDNVLKGVFVDDKDIFNTFDYLYVDDNCRI